MAQKKFQRIIRSATAEERQQHAAIRHKVQQEFPPAPGPHRPEAPPGIPAQIRRAREAKGFTWYAVAKLAGIPNPNTVRDIEYGRDAKLSNVQSVAKVLGYAWSWCKRQGENVMDSRCHHQASLAEKCTKNKRQAAETSLCFVFFLDVFPRRHSLLLLFFWINDS